jgi:hypothetical protein
MLRVLRIEENICYILCVTWAALVPCKKYECLHCDGTLAFKNVCVMDQMSISTKF